MVVAIHDHNSILEPLVVTNFEKDVHFALHVGRDFQKRFRTPLGHQQCLGVGMPPSTRMVCLRIFSTFFWEHKFCSIDCRLLRDLALHWFQIGLCRNILDAKTPPPGFKKNENLDKSALNEAGTTVLVLDVPDLLTPSCLFSQKHPRQTPSCSQGASPQKRSGV